MNHLCGVIESLRAADIPFTSMVPMNGGQIIQYYNVHDELVELLFDADGNLQVVRPWSFHEKMTIKVTMGEVTDELDQGHVSDVVSAQKRKRRPPKQDLTVENSEDKVQAWMETK